MRSSLELHKIEDDYGLLMKSVRRQKMHGSEGPGKEVGWTVWLEMMKIFRITGVDEMIKGRSRWKREVCEEKSCLKASLVSSRHCRQLDVLFGEQVAETRLGYHRVGHRK